MNIVDRVYPQKYSNAKHSGIIIIINFFLLVCSNIAWYQKITLRLFKQIIIILKIYIY